MNISTKYRQHAGAYREVTHPKNHIVLHFTAGSTAAGAAASLQKSGASTAYIVDTDGTIYEFFPPEYWDSHLYRHKKGEDAALYKLERESIGIEIVNLGPLIPGDRLREEIGTDGKPTGKRPDPDWLYTYTRKKHCRLTETSKYVAATYRKHTHWRTFTDAQYQSVAILVQHLCERFQIPFAFLPAEKRIATIPTKELLAFRGITTHVNYRSDKYDIGPAWNWNRLILQGEPGPVEMPIL